MVDSINAMKLQEPCVLMLRGTHIAFVTTECSPSVGDFKALYFW